MDIPRGSAEMGANARLGGQTYPKHLKNRRFSLQMTALRPHVSGMETTMSFPTSLNERADLMQVIVKLRYLRAQPIPAARISGCKTAQMARRNATVGSSALYGFKSMIIAGHDDECAKRHTQEQVPTDTLQGCAETALHPTMSSDFRTALEWHLDHHDATVADIVARTGVSRDVINKLRARPGSSTTVENAMLIASFYGKTVNQFVTCESVTAQQTLQTLIDMLPPEEQRILIAQIHGMLSPRH